MQFYNFQLAEHSSAYPLRRENLAFSILQYPISNPLAESSLHSGSDTKRVMCTHVSIDHPKLRKAAIPAAANGLVRVSIREVVTTVRPASFTDSAFNGHCVPRLYPHRGHNVAIQVSGWLASVRCFSKP